MVLAASKLRLTARSASFSLSDDLLAELWLIEWIQKAKMHVEKITRFVAWRSQHNDDFNR
jgi:hypothetical protein